MAKSSTSVQLEKLLVAGAVSAWVGQAFMMVIMIAQQYSSNQNLSSFYAWAASGLVTPLIVVALIHFTRRKKSLKLHGVYEVLVAATAVMLFSVTLSSVESWMGGWVFMAFGEANSFLLYSLVPVALSLVLTGLVVLYLRRSKDW